MTNDSNHKILADMLGEVLKKLLNKQKELHSPSIMAYCLRKLEITFYNVTIIFRVKQQTLTNTS